MFTLEYVAAVYLRAQIAIKGLSRLLCMQQERQLRRRHQLSATGNGNHVTRGRMKIRSPALPFSKWEPPPYQPRESPTDDRGVVRRPSRVVGEGPACPPAASETARPSGQHCRHPRGSDCGVVVHRPSDGSERRRSRGNDGSRTVTRRTGPPSRREHPVHGQSTDPEASSHAPALSPSCNADDSLAVPIICNYVDPAPLKPDEQPASPPPMVDQGQPLTPAVTLSTPSGVEIGLAVMNEVREVKRMLRSFMAKLSQRDLRERNAFEWRIVALALDRLFFMIYLFIIAIALASMFPWREVFELPKLAKTTGDK